MQQMAGIHGRPNFSSISERIMYPAPPITRDRVSFPPGTICGTVIGGDEAEYLSDHDITAGRIPNSTNTSPKKKRDCISLIRKHKSSKHQCMKHESEMEPSTKEKNGAAIPPYVPAKSSALKNISGSSNDSTNGGIRVSKYG